MAVTSYTTVGERVAVGRVRSNREPGEAEDAERFVTVGEKGHSEKGLPVVVVGITVEPSTYDPERPRVRLRVRRCGSGDTSTGSARWIPLHQYTSADVLAAREAWYQKHRAERAAAHAERIQPLLTALSNFTMNFAPGEVEVDWDGGVVIRLDAERLKALNIENARQYRD